LIGDDHYRQTGASQLAQRLNDAWQERDFVPTFHMVVAVGVDNAVAVEKDSGALGTIWRIRIGAGVIAIGQYQAGRLFALAAVAQGADQGVVKNIWMSSICSIQVLGAMMGTSTRVAKLPP
jgi:hypothetical protein